MHKTKLALQNIFLKSCSILQSHQKEMRTLGEHSPPPPPSHTTVIKWKIRIFFHTIHFLLFTQLDQRKPADVALVLALLVVFKNSLPNYPCTVYLFFRHHLMTHRFKKAYPPFPGQSSARMQFWLGPIFLITFFDTSALGDYLRVFTICPFLSQV